MKPPFSEWKFDCFIERRIASGIVTHFHSGDARRPSRMTRHMCLLSPTSASLCASLPTVLPCVASGTELRGVRVPLSALNIASIYPFYEILCMYIIM